MSQNEVTMYVRSSALGGIGIHWRNISKPDQPIEEPECLKKRVIKRDDGMFVTINSLINETKPSLILAKYEGKILLEVTGIQASENRSKLMGRRISEIVLWVGDASSDKIETKLTQLAALALLSFWNKEASFFHIVSTSVEFDGLNGFKVNTSNIENLYIESDKYLNDSISVSPFCEDKPMPVLTDSEIISSHEELYSLASTISQKSLLTSEKSVVIVAETKINENEQQIIYKSNILKEPAKSLNPEPQFLPEKPEVLETVEKKNTLPPKVLPKSVGSSLKKILVFLMMLVIVMLVWAVQQNQFHLMPMLTPIQKQTPTPTSLTTPTQTPTSTLSP
jgi:hypothetical protein